jgi:hypothetical protein
MATVKCGKCGLRDDKQKMKKGEDKKYYHTEKCYEKHVQDCEFRRKDFQKWCELYEYLKVLHDVPDLPPWNIKRLQELRNGFDFKSGKKYQRYKMGAEYDLMLEAYKLAEEKIYWFIRNVLDKKNTKKADEINACITIMCNYLSDAWKAKKEKELKEKEKERLLQQTKTKDTAVDIEINYKTKSQNKQKDEMDISDLL